MTPVIGIEWRAGSIKITAPGFAIGVGISKGCPIWDIIRIRRWTKGFCGCPNGLNIRTNPDQKTLIRVKILPFSPLQANKTKQSSKEEDK